ncbi:LPXTG cell wall anchor domain-containing protein [Isoptericola halotolerans]|uniref:LPXTG cell wall anchor domain-containing protein n=1 Tax=Isoptericola halotolerans TaxID=300560 RepID=UPI00388F4372
MGLGLGLGYPAPTCEGVLTVTYPKDLPAGQANHVNIKVQNLETDEIVTINIHLEQGTWSGEQTFDPTTDPDWPGWESWAFLRTQVAGTNYHWEGYVEVGCEPTSTPTPVVSPTPSPSPSDEPGPDPSPLPSEAPEGSLDGSIAVGECLEDAPWIRYDVQVTPADAPLEDRSVELVLTDGTNTETIELGELDEDGALSGRVLWPGASVADDGVTPTGWPGWTQLDDGTWVEIDGNAAWTRGDIDATLVVNPELAVDLAYPVATPECATGPSPVEPVDDSGERPTVREQQTLVDPEVAAQSVEAGEAGEDELPQTGSNVALLVAGALALVAAGGAFLWLRRRA